MAKPLHEYDFHSTGLLVDPEYVDWEANLYLSEHFSTLLVLDFLRVSHISGLVQSGYLEVRDDGYAYPAGGATTGETVRALNGWRSAASRLTAEGRRNREAVKTLADEMKATDRIKVMMLPHFPGFEGDSIGDDDPAEDAEAEKDEPGFLRGRARGYSAAIRVERYRAAAEELQAEDPETFQRIVARADGSDAEAAAQRDPVAYVALFMAAADDAEIGTSD